MPQELILQLLNLGVAGILILLLIRGDLVPRSVLEREIVRGDKATDAASQNSAALETVTKTLGEQKDSIKDVRTDVKANSDKLDRVLDKVGG